MSADESKLPDAQSTVRLMILRGELMALTPASRYGFELREEIHWWINQLLDTRARIAELRLNNRNLLDDLSEVANILGGDTDGHSPTSHARVVVGNLRDELTDARARIVELEAQVVALKATDAHTMWLDREGWKRTAGDRQFRIAALEASHALAVKEIEALPTWNSPGSAGRGDPMIRKSAVLSILTRSSAAAPEGDLREAFMHPDDAPPLEGFGSHKADLAELRIKQQEVVTLRAKIARLQAAPAPATLHEIDELIDALDRAAQEYAVENELGPAEVEKQWLAKAKAKADLRDIFTVLEKQLYLVAVGCKVLDMQMVTAEERNSWRERAEAAERKIERLEAEKDALISGYVWRTGAGGWMVTEGSIAGINHTLYPTMQDALDAYLKFGETPR